MAHTIAQFCENLGIVTMDKVLNTVPCNKIDYVNDLVEVLPFVYFTSTSVLTNKDSLYTQLDHGDFIKSSMDESNFADAFTILATIFREEIKDLTPVKSITLSSSPKIEIILDILWHDDDFAYVRERSQENIELCEIDINNTLHWGNVAAEQFFTK